jgi:hypothetical protein
MIFEEVELEPRESKDAAGVEDVVVASQAASTALVNLAAILRAIDTYYVGLLLCDVWKAFTGVSADISHDEDGGGIATIKLYRERQGVDPLAHQTVHKKLFGFVSILTGFHLKREERLGKAYQKFLQDIFTMMDLHHTPRPAES